MTDTTDDAQFAYHDVLESFFRTVLPGYRHTQWLFFVKSIQQNVTSISRTVFADTERVEVVHRDTHMVMPSHETAAVPAPAIVRMYFTTEEPRRLLFVDGIDDCPTIEQSLATVRVVANVLMWTVATSPDCYFDADTRARFEKSLRQTNAKTLQQTGARATFARTPALCVPLMRDWELALVPALCILATCNDLPLLFWSDSLVSDVIDCHDRNCSDENYCKARGGDEG